MGFVNNYHVDFTFADALNQDVSQAAILFDKFHILRHLSDALDDVRRAEYALQGQQLRFIKGNRYTLLAHRENLDLTDHQQAIEHRLPAQGVQRHIGCGRYTFSPMISRAPHPATGPTA